jgi:uncharacterized membrane protein YqiK
VQTNGTQTEVIVVVIVVIIIIVFTGGKQLSVVGN